MTRQVSVFLAAVVALAAVALFFALTTDDAPGATTSAVGTADADEARARASEGFGRGHGDMHDEADVTGARTTKSARRVVSEEERELARALHEAVRAARARTAAGSARRPGERAAARGVQPTGEAEEHGTLDAQFIRDAVNEIKPLLAECYELALEDSPGLAGNLVVEFTIEGEPDVGGVVEDPSIAEDSTLTHPSLDECVRETIYTLRLPAPEGSGRVTVRYPFRFSQEEEREEEQEEEEHAVGETARAGATR